MLTKALSARAVMNVEFEKSRVYFFLKKKCLRRAGSILGKLVEIGSVVFAPDFEVASRVVADWAFFRCFAAFKNVAAVPAFPFYR